MTSQEAATPDAEQPAFCTSRCTGELMNAACKECGHLVALHLSVEHCPVCELVQHNRQMRAAMAANRIEVHVTDVDARTLERIVERLQLRAQIGTRNPGAHFRR